MSEDEKHAAPGGGSVLMRDSKFRPGRANIELVVRDRLTSLLDGALDRRLAAVVAPAGFGKSTLLGQWAASLQEQKIMCAWLSLDDSDAHENQFLASLALALLHAGVYIGDLEIGARNGFSDSRPRSVIANLVGAIERAARECVVILDDYHLAEVEGVDRVVKHLLKDAPGNLLLVINSRTLPSIDAPTLIAAGDAVEISAEQLRLSREETLSALGPSISDDEASAIFEQTEGWPVAVQLARVQKQARPALPLKAGAPGSLVAAYLTEQVLASLDDDVREFLLAVAVLDRFNPDLANAVRREEDSWRLIDRLTRLTALIVPLDIEGDWFRLHHLFAEYLLESLRREAPARMAALRRRASEWYAEKGEIVEAVKYAAAAKDDKACEALILNAGGWRVILTDGIGVLRRMLRALPADVIDASARLLVARAYLHCKDGEQREARALLGKATAINAGKNDKAFIRDFRTVESMLHVYEDTEEWVRAWKETHQNEIDFSAITPLEAGTIKCEEVVAQLSIGDFDGAAASLKSAFAYMRQSGSVLGLNYCYLHAEVAALHRGAFDIAQANISRALELAENNFGSDSGLKYVASVLDFALSVWRGAATSSDIEAFSNALAHVEEYDGWADIYIIGLDAAFHLALQCEEDAVAEELCARFETVARHRNLDRLDGFNEILKYHLEIRRSPSKRQDQIYEQLENWRAAQENGRLGRAWQAYYIGAAALARDADAEVDRVAHAIDRAMEHARRCGATLHLVRLGAAKALLFQRSRLHEESQAILIEAIEGASRQDILGPFLCERSLSRIVKEARDSLRTDEGALIVTDIMADILARANVLRPPRLDQLLSDREQEILEQLASGKTNKEIARQLELTENTVKFHLKNVFSKLSVNRRTQAIAEARRLNLIE